MATASFPGLMTLQILVVEDHGDTRRVLTGLLGHFGHSISAADNVESALAFLRAKHFDAIVSDLALPDGSGCEVIREAKRRQHLTAVALTADGEDGPQRLPAPAGVDHPLGGQSLPGQVQGALDGGGAGLVRADVQQAATRFQQDRSHSSPGLFAAPLAGF